MCTGDGRVIDPIHRLSRPSVLLQKKHDTRSSGIQKRTSSTITAPELDADAKHRDGLNKTCHPTRPRRPCNATERRSSDGDNLFKYKNRWLASWRTQQWNFGMEERDRGITAPHLDRSLYICAAKNKEKEHRTGRLYS